MFCWPNQGYFQQLFLFLGDPTTTDNQQSANNVIADGLLLIHHES